MILYQVFSVLSLLITIYSFALIIYIFYVMGAEYEGNSSRAFFGFDL